MDCKTIHKDLIFYLDNELPNERRIIVQKHLDRCTECREFLALLQSEMQIFSDEKNPEVSPFFYTRLSARLEERQEYQPQNQWVRLVQPVIFMLILVIGIYGGLQLGSNASNSTTNQPATRSIQMLDDFEAEPIESFLLEKL
ncbi:MAG: zf-HC2 domain-containing protein [Bacteroidota bacterium]|nr:zf-HC2 domain-containing protein [Bacteroidota bacterium]